MNTYKQYFHIDRNDWYWLMQDINRIAKDGWELHGEPFIEVIHGGPTRYHAILVRNTYESVATEGVARANV